MNKLMLEDGLLPARSAAILGGGRSHTPRSWLVGACLLALLSSTVPGFADVISMTEAGAQQNSTALHSVAPPPRGTYDLDGHSIDNRGTNGTGAGTTVSTGGAYSACPPTCADAAGPTADPGLRYNPMARPQILWGAGSWDTQGSYAKIAAGPVPGSTVPETALAIAFVTDPQFFTVVFDPAFTPEIDFNLTIESGSTLTATSTMANESSSSMFSGTFDTSLVSGDLFTYSWTADSADPNKSFFQFTSNPILGLNDSAIESTFDSLLSDSGGTHTLTGTFSVDASLFPVLPPGSDTLSYSTSGEQTLESQAQITPEPPTLWLLGTGLIALANVRRRRAGPCPLRDGCCKDQ